MHVQDFNVPEAFQWTVNRTTNLKTLHNVCMSTEEREKTTQRNKGLHLGLNLSFLGFLDCPAAFKQNRYECSCLSQRQALPMFVCVSTNLLVQLSADPEQKPAFKSDLCSPFTLFVLSFLSGPLTCDYWVGRSRIRPARNSLAVRDREYNVCMCVTV